MSKPKFTPLGLLRVGVIEGRNLEAKDVRIMGKATSDPYALVRFEVEAPGNLLLWSCERRSEVRKKTLTPRWDLWAEQLVAMPTEGNAEKTETEGFVNVEVWDWDKSSGDDFMGRVSVFVTWQPGFFS